MSAQGGGMITLAYGPQGAQQGGAGVVLSYSPPAPVRHTVAATTGAPWAAAAPHHAATAAVMPPTVSAVHATRGAWHRGTQRQAQSRQPWTVTARHDAQLAAPWVRFASSQATDRRVPWGLSARRDADQASSWTAFAATLAVQSHAAWAVARALDAERSGPWGQFATLLAKSATHTWATARAVDALRWVPWRRFSRSLSPGWGVVTPPNLTPDEALFAILPARFYMVTHNVFAQRLPDMVDVPIFDATVSADSGSYCWSLSATGPASLMTLLAKVDGLPARLQVSMDGVLWVFAVVPRINREFGKSTVYVQGRSVSALISDPYVRATTRNNAGGDATAQQLALDALQYTGIDLDWGITDWLVSSGGWNHRGTPLDAVQTIAQAAGGYLQSHRSLPTLQVRHPYAQRVGDQPGAPWGWATGSADVELAADAVITDAQDPDDSPDINAVYVSGTTSGVLALVKRTGSAADKLADMIADPLITHVDAARQRGLSILGGAGQKYTVPLDLPVLTNSGQPGVLDVGQLVQVNTATPWRGRVRGVSVHAKMPTLRQTVTLERHLETV